MDIRTGEGSHDLRTGARPLGHIQCPGWEWGWIFQYPKDLSIILENTINWALCGVLYPSGRGEDGCTLPEPSSAVNPGTT